MQLNACKLRVNATLSRKKESHLTDKLLMRPIAPFVIMPTISAIATTDANTHQSSVLESLQAYVSETVKEFDQISAERRSILNQVASEMRSNKAFSSQLTFICTHNSRRSHLSQVWAQTAATYYGLEEIQTFSGGTESTACNIRTVRAMRRAGYLIVDSTGGKNPTYLIQYAENRPLIKVFSKVYNTTGNPTEDFIALMCCDQADEECPVVYGAGRRFAIHYTDPKVSDGTEKETTVYDKRCRQIAREMFYLMSQVAKSK